MRAAPKHRQDILGPPVARAHVQYTIKDGRVAVDFGPARRWTRVRVPVHC